MNFWKGLSAALALALLGCRYDSGESEPGADGKLHFPFTNLQQTLFGTEAQHAAAVDLVCRSLVTLDLLTTGMAFLDEHKGEPGRREGELVQ